MNQLCIANIFMQAGMSNNKIDLDLVRHMILNNIRNHRVTFKNKGFGEVVICCDDNHSWRKDAFPYYKANRKIEREKYASHIDWKLLFLCLETVKAELKAFMPYKVIQIAGAEADDIIAVLATVSKANSRFEETVIISSDKDYMQLLGDGVHQYCPRKKKFLKYTSKEIKDGSLELIIRGDRVDGIPNILSDDDTFVNPNKKQKKMTEDRLAKYAGYYEQVIGEQRLIPVSEDDAPPLEVQRNWKRNKMLIDFEEIPQSLQTEILEHFKQIETAPRSTIFNYFVNSKLRNLMDAISDF